MLSVQSSVVHSHGRSRNSPNRAVPNSDDVMGVSQQPALTFELMSTGGIYFPRYPSCVLDGLKEECWVAGCVFVLTLTLMRSDKGRSRGPVMDGAARKTDAVIRGQAVVHHTFRFWTLTLNERPIALSASSGVRRRKRSPGALRRKESDRGCRVCVKYRSSNSSQTP